MKILNKKILNKAATFLLLAVLLCWNAVKVEAYTALDGYPYILENMICAIGFTLDDVNVLDKYAEGIFNNQNTYSFDFTNNGTDRIAYITFGNARSSFVFPYDNNLYDYYVVGTIASSNTNDVFYIDSAQVAGFYPDGTFWDMPLQNFEIYDFSSSANTGISFSGKIPPLTNTNINRIVFYDWSFKTKVTGNLWMSISIIPISKASEAEQLNQSILNELIKINQNLVTSNSLQQSTIDAINQHDANEKSWFQQLIQNMGLGFSALYKQMTEEKDEQLYGYQNTTTSEAASAFSSESDRLTALEGELSTQSNTYVTDYAAEGFDLGVLATIGSSLIFVTTWFTNFWNMGGVFTACLNFCFALSIVFFILRIKR